MPLHRPLAELTLKCLHRALDVWLIGKVNHRSDALS